MLLRLGLRSSGANYSLVRRTVERLGLDVAHWKGRGWSKGGSRVQTVARPLAAILVPDSSYSNLPRLKIRLLRAGLLTEACAVCGAPPYWNGRDLVLRLDHMDGDNRNFALSNLRLVCPNCDSQLPTYCGRNTKRAASLRAARQERDRQPRKGGVTRIESVHRRQGQVPAEPGQSRVERATRSRRASLSRQSC